MNAEHNQALHTLRQDIHNTTVQLLAAHTAELDSLAATHAATISEMNVSHGNIIGDLKSRTAELEVLMKGYESKEEDFARSEGEIRRLRKEAVELRDRVSDYEKGGKGDEGEDGKESARMKKVLEDLQDELKGTREVSLLILFRSIIGGGQSLMTAQACRDA
jgi:predicted  nucleic acid-binding Zn-ribbon protein